jgi:hypothetical protein
MVKQPTQESKANKPNRPLQLVQAAWPNPPANLASDAIKNVDRQKEKCDINQYPTLPSTC